MPQRPIIKRVVMNSSDVTTLINPDIISFTYTDLLEAGASTFDLEIRNYGRNMATPPKMGDYLEVRFGYSDETAEVNTGTCRVDDVVREYGYDTLRIGARAYDFGIGLKSERTLTFQNSTLKAIIEVIASQAALTVVGAISTEVVGTTSTQVSTNNVTVSGESYIDLARSLAVQYGYAFNLKFGQLIFRSYDFLNAQPAVALITQTDTIPRPRFRENIQGNYQKAKAASKTGSSVILTDNTIPGVTDLVDLSSEGFYNSLNAATLRATGAIIESNKDRHVGQLSTPGKASLVAGNNVTIFGFDTRDDGTYAIDRAVHTLSKSEGWKVQLDLRRIFTQNITTS